MRLPRRRAVLAWLGAAGAAGSWRVALGQSAATVAAASDLQFALEDVAAAFERTTGQRLRLVFGSSGNFYAQLLQDAPFDLFLSADEDYVLRLADAGKTLDRGRLYALGRIALVATRGSPLAVDPELKGLGVALREGRVQKFAIANPEHAPYGRRAEEALRHAGLWDAIRPRLVLGENVSQAAQFAVSGGAQGGIVSLSLALSPKLAPLAAFATIPEGWHAPLRQRMVLTKRASPAARAFYEHLATPEAQAVLARFGFVLPRT